MIPASVVVGSPQLEIADGSTGDAGIPAGTDPDGAFAAALFGVMEAATDATAEKPPMLDVVADTATATVDNDDAGNPQPAATAAFGAAPALSMPVETTAARGSLRWQSWAPAAEQSPADGHDAASRIVQAAERREATDLAWPKMDVQTDGDAPISGDALLPAAPDAARMTATAVMGATDPAQRAERSGNALDQVPVEAQRLSGPMGLEPSPRSGLDAPARPQPPPVQAPLHTPQWSHEFAARVTWVVERGDQLASIRLNPEELGPVEVRVAIREGEASIWFGATQADTRAAIEQALPRLREMLASSGLALADSGVFREAPREPRQGFTRADARRAAVESATSSVDAVKTGRRSGLIDDYA